MPQQGLTLASEVTTSLTNTMTGIVTTIVNVAPVMIIAGIGIWGVMLVFKKIPQWVKTFAR